MDCNKCKHLNMTEKEQVDKRKDHICLIYNKRVFHNSNTVKHDERLYPCWKCRDNDYACFEDRK